MSTSATASLSDDLAARFAALTPRSAEETREYEWTNCIVPRLVQLGFSKRFCEPIDLSAEQRTVKGTCEMLLRRKGAIVVLCGKRGGGKTTLAAQIAIDRVRYFWNYYSEPDPEKRGIAPRALPFYFKSGQLVAKYKTLKADYGSIDGEQLEASFDSLCHDCGLIVIDEWHECEDQKMRDRVLMDLIDRFYACLNDVLIISNQSAADFISGTNPSILSRLEEHGKIIPCNWPSQRTK